MAYSTFFDEFHIHIYEDGLCILSNGFTFAVTGCNPELGKNAINPESKMQDFVDKMYNKIYGKIN